MTRIDGVLTLSGGWLLLTVLVVFFIGALWGVRLYESGYFHRDDNGDADE